MTILKLDILCDKCGFRSGDRFDFGGRHFSRIRTDGKDETEYFHLCSECQIKIAREISDSLPKITLKTIAKTRHEGVEVCSARSGCTYIHGLATHKGIII